MFVRAAENLDHGSSGNREDGAKIHPDRDSY